MTTFNESEHPRNHPTGKSRFAEKANSGPEALLGVELRQLPENLGKSSLEPKVAVGESAVTLGWMSPEEAAERYRNTPVWAQIGAGHSGHVGGGLWRTSCRECPEYVEHWGSMPRHATIGRHEVDEHGLLVGGINLGMLPGVR